MVNHTQLRDIISLTVSLVTFFVIDLPLSAQNKGDFIESTSYNESKRDIVRSLQYYPEGDDFVCINGTNRFTRALYCSASSFRIETSDRPVFAAYIKRHSKNIRFYVRDRSEIYPLDSVAFCEARYTCGCRTYRLTDPLWGRGELRISVLACADADGAVWRFSSSRMPATVMLIAVICEIKSKHLNRNGDMGADPADSFEASAHPCNLHKSVVSLSSDDSYLILKDSVLLVPSHREGKNIYRQAEKRRFALTTRIKFDTPDSYINPIGGDLAVAADAIWSGQTWLHGAVGWRMPLSGWRAAYVGDVLGWHQRARKHFDAYAASQVTTVPCTISHPTQDSAMNMSRGVERWGTPMYSNGYICRNPYRNNQMHHYDMNLCYIDELLWHFNWTGGLKYACQMWPVIVRHLAWEKKNFDPDDDGLFDAYACIWASDALYYNSGAVTHSSAYNYRAFSMAAEIADKLGKNSRPYREEAAKILTAINAHLWIPNKGHWAEYQDFMGMRRLHESAAVWTIYHAIDSDIANPFQAYEATRYVDTEIPHIAVRAEGLKDDDYATISTTNWLPYSWSINNVAFAEVMHTALAYFKSGRADDGYRLLKSAILDGMYLGSSPGNFGQLSFYDAARGECYRDFGDVIGIASRTLIEGLYGIIPDAMNGRLFIRPGFPSTWMKAGLTTPDISYRFSRRDSIDHYQIEQSFTPRLQLTLEVPAQREAVSSVRVNGKLTTWSLAKSASGQPIIAIHAPAKSPIVIEIVWSGQTLFFKQNHQIDINLKSGELLHFKVSHGASIIKYYDPQGIFSNLKLNMKAIEGTIANHINGYHTFFVQLRQGQMQWWYPVNIRIRSQETASPESFAQVDSTTCFPVNMDEDFNANVTDIFKNKYISPRSPYTTLQIPTQGIGEWCHPLLMANIDDSGIRSLSHKGLFSTPMSVPFRTPKVGRNIVFTSLWDNYPDSLSIRLDGHASHVYLMLAGSTNHMQCHIANGLIRIYYTDGTSDVLNLVNPDNWCPIEQDFFEDGKAFCLSHPRPYRIALKSGLISRDLCKKLHLTGAYDRSINGGAGILLDMPIQPSKTLSHLILRTLSNDVVIGLMGITLQR